MSKGLLTYIEGDATSPETKNTPVILVAINALGKFNGSYGAALAEKYPSGQIYVRRSIKGQGNNSFWGMISTSSAPPYICAMQIVRDTPRSGTTCPFSYMDLQSAISNLSQTVTSLNYTKKMSNRKSPYEVHMPRLCCGKMGADWEEIEEMINTYLLDKGINVFVYDLPKAPVITIEP